MLAIYCNCYWNNKIKVSTVRPRSAYGIDKNIREIMVKMTRSIVRFEDIDTDK
jgi:hypothetical protein